MEEKLIPTSENLVKEFYEDHKAEVLKRVSGSVRLLMAPDEYARGAIISLEDQLTRVRSQKKKARIERKLKEWRLSLTVMENENGKESGNI